ncbi:hypothetical protein N9468_04625 [Flavobacteriaceae bacterium]|nr:hypothetical protein [Flavobacteriaceae bacterium]
MHSDDARWLAPRLREWDRLEGRVLYDSDDHVEGLRQSLRASYASGVLMVDGEIIAAGGEGHGMRIGWCCPWFVGTDAISDHPVTIMRYAKFFVAYMKVRYKGMENWMLPGHQAARDLVEVLGFTFDGSVWSINGNDLDHFVWRAS